jgi:hypothetical protein
MNFMSIPPARELTRAAMCAKCGHRVCFGDRVTNDENATGVPRVFATPPRSGANHGTVMWLAVIAARQSGAAAGTVEPLVVPHIRNAADEFRGRRRVQIDRRSASGHVRRRNTRKFS